MIGIEENDLKVFFDGFRTYYDLTQEYKRDLDLELSTSFSPFNYIKWDERTISRIFKDIITQDGDHGQRKAFIEIFVRFLLEQKEHYSQLIEKYLNDTFQVKVEQYTGTIWGIRGFIDIYIKSKNVLIGIENKPFDKDQKLQLSRYNEYLKNNCNNSHYLIVYLSNRKPSDDSISRISSEEKKKSYIEIDYNTLSKILENMVQVCKSYKYRLFLEDFIKQVRSI